MNQQYQDYVFFDSFSPSNQFPIRFRVDGYASRDSPPARRKIGLSWFPCRNPFFPANAVKILFRWGWGGWLPGRCWCICFQFHHHHGLAAKHILIYTCFLSPTPRLDYQGEFKKKKRTLDNQGEYNATRFNHTKACIPKHHLNLTLLAILLILVLAIIQSMTLHALAEQNNIIVAQDTFLSSFFFINDLAHQLSMVLPRQHHFFLF